MDLLNAFILGYNINIVELLTPVINLSVMTIFAVVFILLSRRTKSSTYFIIAVTLELLSLYNIISVVMIFFKIYNLYPNITTNLYIFNNILVLFTVLIMPLNNRNFLSDIKAVNVVNNCILIITGILIIALLIISLINFDAFFGVNINQALHRANRIYYRISPEGLFYLFKMYIILFVFAATLIPVILDIISEHNVAINIVFNIFSLIGLYLIFTDINLFKAETEMNFDRTGLAITLSYMIRFIATFSSFTVNALTVINKDNVLVNRLKSNLNILTTIHGISDKLNMVDKNFMDSSMFVFEIDRENKDALDIMNSKVENIITSKDNLEKTKENKNQLIKDGIRFTSDVFNIFETYKNKLQDNCKVLNGIIKRIKESDFSNNEIKELNEDLKNIKNDLQKTSKKFTGNMLEYSSQFKDISAITGEIYETIEYIKNMTNKTNLLSINAGIQSTKAGVYGRSFSVVAKEIGVLSTEISQGTENLERILINIFSGLVMVENAAFYVEEHCKLIEDSVNDITKEMEDYLKTIENSLNFEYSSLESFETLEKYNNEIFNIVEEQSDIATYIRENINAMLDIQNSLNSKIDFQNQDIIKIFNNFNNVMKSRERLNDTIKKVGNYSSLSHTNIEALSNIISTHKKKSSITFAPIITLLKSSKIR